jgi:hypothetical protein
VSASKIIAIIGTIILVVSGLTLANTTKDLVRAIRFSGGYDRVSEYIVAANIGYAAFDGIVTIVLAGIGAFMVRRHLRARKPRTAAGIGLAVALILGIGAGLT